MSPYLTEIESSLPRLLSLFDSDPTNMSYGQGGSVLLVMEAH